MTMYTKTTSGIKISVKCNFNDKLSFIEDNSYVFSYDVTIENYANQQVQLISRSWTVFDSLNDFQYVNGLGVIGEQPILNVQDKHQYTSYCEIKSELGYMEGYYIFKNLISNQEFKVEIPRFLLQFKGKLN